MKIRAATLEDIDIIIKLGNSVNEFQVSDEVIAFWPKNVLADCIKDENSPVLVAKENKQIAGFIIANYNPSFRKATIENIYVDPDFREKGVGNLLLNNLLDNLKKLGCEYVCSLAEIENSASVNFFLNNDFKKGMSCVWLNKILDDSFKK